MRLACDVNAVAGSLRDVTEASYASILFCLCHLRVVVYDLLPVPGLYNIGFALGAFSYALIMVGVPSETSRLVSICMANTYLRVMQCFYSCLE